MLTAERGDVVPDRAPPPEPRRSLLRRRPLPGGRAVLGGFLVAASAVGIFVAYSQAASDRTVPFVVAARAISVGHRLASDDLTTEHMQLPRSLGDQLAFRDPRTLLGALAVEPLRAGELVQVSDVVEGGTVDRQLSFSVPRSRAVDGALEPGDQVDMLATYGSGAAGSTIEVAQGLTIVSVTEQSGSFAAAGDPTEVLTVTIQPSVNALALAQAVNTGQVVLVRSTGSPPSADAGPYQAPAGAAGGASSPGSS